MRFVRRNDVAGGDLASVKPNLEPILGRWYNTNHKTGEITCIDLALRNGAFTVNAFGAADETPIDWGEVDAVPFVSQLGSREVTGFEAHYDFGFMQTHLAANVKYGVLVIQSYNRFHDDSGRGSYFTREFFHQEVERDDPSPKPSDVVFRMLGDLPDGQRASSAVSLAGYVGKWKNTYRASKVISHFTLEERTDGCYLHAFGVASPKDWGEIKVTPFAPNVDSTSAAAFFGRYNFGFMDMSLAANDNKGLVIIASYNDFKDGGERSSYFTRQFFYRDRS